MCQFHNKRASYVKGVERTPPATGAIGSANVVHYIYYIPSPILEH